jgi:GTP cyclohydrolase I
VSTVGVRIIRVILASRILILAVSIILHFTPKAFNCYHKMVKFSVDGDESRQPNCTTNHVFTPGNEEHERVNSGGDSNVANGGNEGQKKRRKIKKSKDNGHKSHKRRRYSISKAARDPRDEASPIEAENDSRSPSPVIDFDGLSRPSTFPRLCID